MSRRQNPKQNPNQSPNVDPPRIRRAIRTRAVAALVSHLREVAA